MPKILKIIYTPVSRTSLKEIYKYIAKDNKAAAQKTVDKIYNIINLIATNPYIGVVGRVENTREFFIPYTNYFIVYVVNKDIIKIVNIIHTSKNY